MNKSRLSLFLAILFCLSFFAGCIESPDDTQSRESGFEVAVSNKSSEEASENQWDDESMYTSLISDDTSETFELSETSVVLEQVEESEDERVSEAITSSSVDESESEESSETSDDFVSEVESSVSEQSSEEQSEQSSEQSTETSTEQSSDDSSEDAKTDVDVYAPVTLIPKTLEKSSLDSFFDDSVFIGYSIMMHFGKYISQWKIEIDESIMGDSKFCCGVGMNFIKNRKQTPDTPNNTLPKFQGEAYNFEDLPKATDSKSMYIGLMVYSELKSSTVENCIDYALNETILGIEKIREKNPDLHLVILSGTYNTGTYDTGALNPQRVNNENVRLYNIKVLEYCNEMGIDFIDVSTPLLDGRGFMPVKYASDRDYHIKKDVFKIWINILRDYAEKKQNGEWKNLETMPPLVKE